MLTETLQTLQGLAPIVALRGSTWTYPIVNAGHIVGLALLFGAIVPMDLRLLGVWRVIPLRTVAGITIPTAIVGLIMAIPTGALLFAVRAVEYAPMPLLQAKLVLVLGALANALLLRRTPAWRAFRDADCGGTTLRLRIAGALSIGLWLGVIVCGRMIGYLD